MIPFFKKTGLILLFMSHIVLNKRKKHGKQPCFLRFILYFVKLPSFRF